MFEEMWGNHLPTLPFLKVKTWDKYITQVHHPSKIYQNAFFFSPDSACRATSVWKAVPRVNKEMHEKNLGELPSLILSLCRYVLRRWSCREESTWKLNCNIVFVPLTYNKHSCVWGFLHDNLQGVYTWS